MGVDVGVFVKVGVGVGETHGPKLVIVPPTFTILFSLAQKLVDVPIAGTKIDVKIPLQST